MSDLIVIASFVLVIIVLVAFHSFERKKWNEERVLILDEAKKEREGLYERIHSGSYAEYKHGEVMKIRAEKPKEQTTLEEV